MNVLDEFLDFLVEEFDDPVPPLAESAVGDFGVFIMSAVELKKLSLHYEVSKWFLGFDDDVLVVSNLVG